MNTPSRKRGLLAGITAIAASAMLILAGGSAAHAAPSVVDPDAKGSITFHKFDQPAGVTNLPNDGSAIDQDAIDAANLQALGGAKFTATRVGTGANTNVAIDLATNAGWQTAQDLTVAGAATQLLTGTGNVFESGATDAASGEASVTNLPIGLYYVQETTTPAGHMTSAPFLITVPLTDPADQQSWLYNVHVYPKNSAVGTKTVNDENAVKLGDEIVWTITGNVQAPAQGQSIDGYAIADKLDEKLGYVAADASAAPIKLGAVAAITIPAAAGQLTADDYTVKHFADTNTVVAVLKASGLAKLDAAKKANAATQVTLTVPTVVNQVGEISNTGLIFPNKDYVDANLGDDPTDPTDPTDPQNPCEEFCPFETPESVTKFGNVNFTKTGKDGDKAAALAGAEFQVFLTEADAKAKTNPVEFTKNADGTATAPSPKDTFTSDANGKVNIEGLRYSKWVDGAEITSTDPVDGYQAYWIVETKAPDGYELLAEPIKVEVNSADQALIVSGATGTDDLLGNVVNKQKNAGFELPLTGGAGTWMLTAASLLLAAGAITMVIRRQKRGIAA
ncbi:SpaH/EbpB family LPXTG-anchored major pilin [Leucobacter sp. HY1910]